MALRYFADPLPDPQRPTLPPDTEHHLRHALRARPGDRYRLFDGRGGESWIEVTSAERRRFEIEVLEQEQHQRRARLEVELCYSPPPDARHAQILEHGCELGVTSFRPIVFERTKPHARGRTDAGAGASRALRILRAAAGQCGALHLPELHEPPTAFADIVDRLPDVDLKLACERRDVWPGPTAGLDELTSNSRVRIFVGPEGGLTEGERTRLVELGYRALSIGPHVLRVETACLAATALVAGSVE